MRYSPPAERHERHESTPDPAKHETNLGVGWTPPVFPSGDTNTMMKLKDWLSFTLNYVIWIGYHKFLLKMHQTGARQGTPQEKQNEAAPAKKTEMDPAPLGQPSCSVATSSLRTWDSPARKHNLIHHPKGRCCGAAPPHGRKAMKNQAV